MANDYPYVAAEYISEDFQPNQIKIEKKNIKKTENKHYCDEFEFYLILSGNATVDINNSFFTVEKGALIQFMPFHIHRFILKSDQDLEVFHIKLSLGLLINTSTNKNLYLRSIKKLNTSLPLVKLDDRMFDKVCFFCNTTLEEYQISTEDKGTLNLSLISFLSYAYDKGLKFNRQSPKNMFWSCLQYIQFHHQEPLTIDDVSQKLGLPAIEIKQLIKKGTGCTFSQFLNQVRIRNATALLQFNDLSINQIGRICGYKNDAYFYKQFKAVRNITPKHYQDNLKNKQFQVSNDSWMLIIYLFENFNQEITIKDVKEKFSMSQSKINSLIKSKTGMNFKEFINSLRIQIGQNLINNFNYPISTAAIKVGFNDINTYHRNYEKYRNTIIK
jgi:AraC-like DNA-binding protein/mannose-6-phosphate isomerase-like protein (cupin superfamily)